MKIYNISGCERVAAQEYAYASPFDYIQSGNWQVANTMNCTAQTAAAITVSGTMQAFPFFAPTVVNPQVEQLGVRITVAATGSGVIGIYDTVSFTNLYPNNLICSGAKFALTSGFQSTTLPASVALVPGALYWAVIHGTANPTVMRLPAAGIMTPLGINSQTVFSQNNAVGWTVARLGAGTTLPSTFTAGGTLITNPGTAIVPSFYLKYVANQ